MTEATPATELTPAEVPAKQPFPVRFSAPLLLGSTLNPINSSMIATGLVGIGVDLHAGPGATAALISVLYLCSVVAQPTMGKLSSIFGPRRVFLSGLLILLVAGVVGTFAPSFAWLLLSRALIGIGTSAAYPTAMALVRRRADECGVGVPSRVLGNFAIAAQVSAVIGLPLGGVLIGVFGWRALFFVNIPVALLSIVLTSLGVAKDGPVTYSGVGALLKRIDIPGIILFAGTIVGLLASLADLSHPIWWLVPVVVVLGVSLVFWERRSASPLIDVRMLARNRPLQQTYIRQILVSLANYSVLYGVSQWMEQGRGLDASQVGLLLIPTAAVSIVVARVVSTNGWVRWPLQVSSLALLAAALVTAFVTRETSIPVLVGLTMLYGLSGGLAGFANQATLYANAPAAQIAVASGLLRAALYLGAIFSSGLIGIVFGARASDAGLHQLGWVQFGLGLALVLLVAFDRQIPNRAAK